MKILLATKNKDKVREIRAALSGLNIEVLSAADMPELPDVEEDAPTLEGNALKKAETIFKITQIPCVADDTGLEVEALNGAPGVFSARYSGPNATYQDNVNKLLHEMRDVPSDNRKARFRTVMAYTSESGSQTVEGVCDGRITTAQRGNNGFGYDPVFEVGKTGKTLAEMPLEEKNKISHRGRAIREIVSLFEQELGGNKS